VGAVGGVQVLATPVGLANGNILAGWSDNSFGPSAGTDITAQLFDTQANKIGGFIELNTISTSDNELIGDIKALPGGGFILTYVDDQGAGADVIRLERYDENGAVVFSTFTAAGGVVSDPKLSVSLNGNYMLNFVRDNAGDLNVRAHIFNGATNAATAEFDAAGNGTDDFNNAESAGLTNNNFVIVSARDPAAGTNSIEFKIVNSAGTQVVVPTTVAGSNSINPDVVGLAQGGFVVTYTRGNDLFFRIGTNGGVLGAETTIASGANNQNFAKLVALQDGGFFVVWDDQTAADLIGQRYSSTGAAIGGNIVIDDTAGSPQHEVSLTSDGRILVGWFDAEPKMVILDPRETTINGTSAKDVLTTRLEASDVFAGNGDDTVFGQGGDDVIEGGGGIDTIFGGGGNDIVRVLNNQFIDDVDGGTGTDTLDLSPISVASATVDLEGLTWQLSPDFGGIHSIVSVETVKGTALADTLIGSSGVQTLEGNGGDDSIDGGLDNDILRGGAGNDQLDGGAGIDSMSGGADNDTYFVELTQDAIVELLNEGIDEVRSSAGNYTLGDNLENLILDGAGANNGTGNALANIITGNLNNNSLFGLDGSDTLDGGGGNDSLRGGKGNDVFIVDSLADAIFELAGEGTDTVETTLASYTLTTNVEKLRFTDGGNHVGKGNAEDNTLQGNAGIERFVFDGIGNDTYSGGLNSDLYDMRLAPVGAILDFVTDVHGGAALGEIFASIEKFLGSETAGDTMTGNANKQNFFGGGGNDILSGGGQSDRLNGDEGNDILDGGTEKDNINGGADDDTLTGGAARDFFEYTIVNFGNDTVTDYEDGLDRLKFFTDVADDFSDFTISGNGTGNVVVTLIADPANSITLQAAGAITIAANDFTFFS
jgi:Ca2+-binding RTX toxin-like protein